MPSHAEFIANIAQHPTLMGPRLVYSDWLEERGDVRGEFIRTWIELSEAIPEPALTNILQGGEQKHLKSIPKSAWDNWSAFVKKMRRIGDLLAEHRREWTMAGLPEEWGYVADRELVDEVCTERGRCGDQRYKHIRFEFRAGFPEVLTLRFEEWQRHYRTLIDAMPAREVNLTSEPTDKWLANFIRKAKVNLPDNFTIAQMLAAEFPGHDPANPIRYTLPARQAEYVMDGFVQTEIEQFLPIEPPFITDPV